MSRQEHVVKLKNPLPAVDGDGLVWLYQPPLGMPRFDAMTIKRTDDGHVRVVLLFEQYDYVLELDDEPPLPNRQEMPREAISQVVEQISGVVANMVAQAYRAGMKASQQDAEDIKQMLGMRENGQMVGLKRRYSFIATHELIGMNTGHRRYTVRCMECGETLHSMTTGPLLLAQQHDEEECSGKK
jgi:hypothetical protein